MVVMGLDDGEVSNVRALEVHLRALILEDHVMWRLGADKEMSLFPPSSGYDNNKIDGFRLLYTNVEGKANCTLPLVKIDGGAVEAEGLDEMLQLRPRFLPCSWPHQNHFRDPTIFHDYRLGLLVHVLL